MGWRVTWAISCDHCHATGPRRHRGKTPGADAERAAVNAGWLVATAAGSGVHLHLCGECRAKVDELEWWPLDAEEVETR